MRRRSIVVLPRNNSATVGYGSTGREPQMVLALGREGYKPPPGPGETWRHGPPGRLREQGGMRRHAFPPAL